MELVRRLKRMCSMAQSAQQSSRRLSDNVYQYLTDGIREGRWKAGEKLPSEAELCSELETSRSTVRSALERLNGLGLVQSFQGKGTFVCAEIPHEPPRFSVRFDTSNRLDVFEFRRILESESAALAAMRATAADVEEIERSITSMADGQTMGEIAEQDLRFHHLIARCSGNAVIQGVFEVMRPIYAEMFMTNVSHMHKAGVQFHRRILLAIQSRDMQGSRQAMEEHIDDAMRAVCRTKP